MHHYGHAHSGWLGSTFFVLEEARVGAPNVTLIVRPCCRFVQFCAEKSTWLWLVTGSFNDRVKLRGLGLVFPLIIAPLIFEPPTGGRCDVPRHVSELGCFAITFLEAKAHNTWYRTVRIVYCRATILLNADNNLHQLEVSPVVSHLVGWQWR